MRQLLPAIITLLTLASCLGGKPTADKWSLNDRELDSLSFRQTHHYTTNANFVVTADTLSLSCRQPDELPFDSVTAFKGEPLVVAEVMTMPGDSVDSVWVKLARDQYTQGWTRERTLLQSACPDDPISQFISYFSNVHLLVFLALLIIAGAAYAIKLLMRRKAYIVHLHDIESPYPAAVAVTVAVAACLYGTIQHFFTSQWVEYYFHPTLNPFVQPPVIAIFLIAVWVLLVLALAAVDDVIHRLEPDDAVLYLCSLAAVAALNYVVFSLTTLYYIGYPLLLLYIFAVARRANVSAA